MEPWRIGVLCLICVVFAILVTVVLCWCWRRISQETQRRTPSPNLFHFYDFGRQLRTILVDQYEGRPVEAGSAERWDLHRPDHFKLVIAKALGEPTPQTIAISRVGPGNVMVELDMPAFLRRGDRDNHLRSTAFIPCTLSRHYQYKCSEPPALSVAPVEDPFSGASASRSASASRVPHRSQPPNHVPLPLVLPVSPNITTNTPITISCAQYRYTDGVDDIVPIAVTERIEQAIVDGHSGPVSVGHGGTADVDPRSQSAVVAFPERVPRTAQRFVPIDANACTLEYGFEGPNHFLRYSGPFYLPPGRWSLVAKTIHEASHVVRSQSRVFTVEAN